MDVSVSVSTLECHCWVVGPLGDIVNNAFLSGNLRSSPSLRCWPAHYSWCPFPLALHRKWEVVITTGKNEELPFGEPG